MAQIFVPFDADTVKRLNALQQDERFHGYTCPGDQPECEASRLLIATRDGWVCRCGRYKQDWAHEPAR